MARRALIVKQRKEPKFKVRKYNRCMSCGRARAFLRDFGLCRLCFRGLALDGKVPVSEKQVGNQV